ncbi:MAG TPA: hypothetical protein VH722_18935 [Alphaproteobacteria bacterium]|nr:hypothetical protein [Alphaproteobacteria bacterium]
MIDSIVIVDNKIGLLEVSLVQCFAGQGHRIACSAQQLADQVVQLTKIMVVFGNTETGVGHGPGLSRQEQATINIANL